MVKSLPGMQEALRSVPITRSKQGNKPKTKTKYMHYRYKCCPSLASMACGWWLPCWGSPFLSQICFSPTAGIRHNHYKESTVCFRIGDALAPSAHRWCMFQGTWKRGPPLKSASSTTAAVCFSWAPPGLGCGLWAAANLQWQAYVRGTTPSWADSKQGRRG